MWLFLLFVVANKFHGTSSCTSFIVGRKATVDGSVMATHTNDGGGDTDPRLVRIPERFFKYGDLRPIFGSPESYPRYVGYERGASSYYPENCEAGDKYCSTFEPIGYIPQVNHTFAYFEETYGAINEKQVGIAESTCSGVFLGKSVEVGGKALLSVDQLSQIAMERASTARQAVSIMGELAEKYGFYGESQGFEGSSESLLVTDPLEAWVFHILPDPTAASAIWVAAKVPDDSAAVVANMFTIRIVDLDDVENFLGKKDMWTIAEQQGLYKKGDPKDFTATFSDGEYAHKYYSGRRVYGVFRLLAPSLALPSEYDNIKKDAPYPFTVKVENKVTVQDCFAILRDFYDGTNFSTSVGLASGPFNTPDRYGTGYDKYGSWLVSFFLLI
jgi:dipeptidase